MRNIEKKYDILKARLMGLIEEHADALALAQKLNEEREEALKKVSKLEEKLKEFNDVQKEEPRITIINNELDSTEQ